VTHAVTHVLAIHVLRGDAVPDGSFLRVSRKVVGPTDTRVLDRDHV